MLQIKKKSHRSVLREKCVHVEGETAIHKMNQWFQFWKWIPGRDAHKNVRYGMTIVVFSPMFGFLHQSFIFKIKISSYFQF